MKLDIHTHILPSSLPDLKQRYGCPGWINIKPSAEDPNVANMYKDDQFFDESKKTAGVLKTDARICEKQM